MSIGVWPQPVLAIVGFEPTLCFLQKQITDQRPAQEFLNPDSERMGGIYLRSLMKLMKSAHRSGEKVSTGPLGSLLSRI